MGTFLALSSVLGKSHDQVVDALTKYTISVEGGIEQKDGINYDTYNCCIIKESEGNTSVFYPNGYLEWDESSQFISNELNATVFSFHIHDGDLWMYVLYNNGEVIDKFNPIPDYWDDTISEDEINEWRGNVNAIVKYIPFVDSDNIKNYLARWDLDSNEEIRAYPSDEFAREDWQMVDFMKKLNLPYPIDNAGKPNGNIYKMWTKQLKLTNSREKTVPQRKNPKAWWKFW